MENWTDTAEGHFEASQDIEIASVLAPKKRPPNPSRFTFEKVNEVTWKLTNGEMTNVPASHGQWGGYRVTKAVAWVSDVGPHKQPAWIARYKDQCTNPTDLREAKAAAMAMAKGACGDYVVRDPIAHLNGLAAMLDAQHIRLFHATTASASASFCSHYRLEDHGWLEEKQSR